jgi:hypothetical protein
MLPAKKIWKSVDFTFSIFVAFLNLLTAIVRHDDHRRGTTMRKPAESISLEEVKDCLRRGRGGEIRNCGGWSVFEIEGRPPRFIVDSNCNCQPVPYASVKTLSVAIKRSRRASLAVF